MKRPKAQSKRRKLECPECGKNVELYDSVTGPRIPPHNSGSGICESSRKSTKRRKLAKAIADMLLDQGLLNPSARAYEETVQRIEQLLSKYKV